MTRLCLLMLSLTCAALLLPPGAAAAPQVGIGEQHPQFFTDPQFTRLHLRDARLLVSWDALSRNWETAEIDTWMRAARRARVRPLVTFSHSRAVGRERVLPTRRAYARAITRFRARYPHVVNFQAWNEANHPSQPTFRRPDRAAAFYDALVDRCHGCRVSAPAVLDTATMTRWIKRFELAARRPVRIWSLHNYGDANHFRTIRTRRMLNATKGEVWFTETGGIVNRWIDGRPHAVYDEAHAARATRQVFRLARLTPRVTRIYLYHWTAPDVNRPRWDSALIGRDGRARPAYHTLRRELAALPSSAPVRRSRDLR